MKWLPGRCRTGDLIRVHLGSVCHYGVFVSEDEVIAFGLPPVEQYRDDPRRLIVCSTDIDTFACGSIVEIAHAENRQERRKRRPPKKAVADARARLGETGYNLLHNNCEHFARECVFGEHRCELEEAAVRRWRERPVCAVYLAAMDDMAKEDAVYPPERAREIERCTDPGLRAAKRADWALLGFAVKQVFGREPESLTFRCSRHGKWSCEELYFSLSHAGGYAAAAVSSAPVGVDMEGVEAFFARRTEEEIRLMAKRAMTSAEHRRWGGDPAAFLTCWTRKEAVFKCRGRGAFRPAAADADDAGVRSCRVMAGDTELALALCGRHSAQARFYLMDGDGAHPVTPRFDDTPQTVDPDAAAE